MKKLRSRILLTGRAVFIIMLSFSILVFSPVQALTTSDIKSINDGTWAYDPNATACTTASTPVASGTANTNVDYAGRQILSSAQLQAISQNTSVYQQAASQVDIPWQMIAAIHLIESGGKLYNPINGQGIYQFVDKHGGPYPMGPVTPAEFLRQTILVAQYIKAKAASNGAANKNLTATSPVDTIKDTFFSYNGRAGVYIKQAQSLGFSASQGYEGSPYVMNIADAQRDPVVNSTTWGQIKGDYGAISYPANKNVYGAFVTYAALAGISLGGACNSTAISGNTQNKVMQLARQELSAWATGTLQPNGSDYHKYTGGASENWCADFISWLYNQAGYPLSTTVQNGRIPAVAGIQAIGQQNTRFSWHAVGSYTPKPGDIAIYGSAHTNLVVAVNGTSITVIGGNQGGGSGANSYSRSKVSQYDIGGYNSGPGGLTGFVSPNGG